MSRVFDGYHWHFESLVPNHPAANGFSSKRKWLEMVELSKRLLNRLQSFSRSGYQAK
jgi:hypothetical protein